MNTIIPVGYVPFKVPTRVPMAYARKALILAGKLAAVNAAIDALAEPARSLAKTDWEYQTHVRRDDQWVQALAPLLGTPEEIDALFIAADQMDRNNA